MKMAQGSEKIIDGNQFFASIIFEKLAKKITRGVRKIYYLLDRRKIEKERDLCELMNAIEKNSSFNCWKYCSKLLRLYNLIRVKKFKEVLEFGSGISTIIIALALKLNEQESGIKGRLTSMEENNGAYFDFVKNTIPVDLNRYVDLISSPKVDDNYYFFHGVRYKDIPDRKFDFVLIDGPTTSCVSNGQKAFDLDFIRVLEKSHSPLDAMVDNRRTTCYVLKFILGKKVKFNYFINLGFISSVSKSDIVLSDFTANKK